MAGKGIFSNPFTAKTSRGTGVGRSTKAPAVGKIGNLSGGKERVVNMTRLGKQFGTQPTPKRLKYFAKGTGKGSK